MNRDKNSIDSLMTVIKEIMWNAEFAISSYAKLRPRFVYLSAEGANSVFSNHSGSSGAESANSGFSNHSGSSGAQSDFHQLLTMSPRFHCYSSATRRPSPFMQQTVVRFEDDLGKCCKFILELEQLVQMKDDKTFAESLESLSNVMSNVHDYLIHVASKVSPTQNASHHRYFRT
jgi:nucleoporin p58/p45